MNKKILIIIFVILAVACGLTFLGYYCTRAGQTQAEDEACIREVVQEYTRQYKALYKYEITSQANAYRESFHRKKILKSFPKTRERKFYWVLPKLPRNLPKNSDTLKKLADIFECVYPPLAISDRGVQLYDAVLPSPPCLPNTHANDILSDTSKSIIAKSSNSVARLSISDTYNPDAPPSFWGTGFLIAPGVIATPCHVIAPLIGNDRQLDLAPGETLNADFEPTYGFSRKSKSGKVSNITTVQILKVMGCPDRSGFDIALLDFCTKENADGTCDQDISAHGIPLFTGDITSILPTDETLSFSFILIGYADLEHFVDPDRKAIYDPWVQSKASNKFAMIDQVFKVDPCDYTSKDQANKDDVPPKSKLEIVLDDDSTTIGESGSMLLYLNVNAPMIVGMHTCCSGYFPYDLGHPPNPVPENLHCAYLRRTFYNQDISSRAILTEPILCKVLEKRHAQQVDIAGHVSNIACSQ
jgi:hypothetical protein